MRLLTTWTKYHSQVQQRQHSVTKMELWRQPNGVTTFPDATQPAAREVFQLTVTEDVCLQRNGLSPLETQQPPPSPPTVGLYKDCWPRSIFRGENYERRVTTEMPTATHAEWGDLENPWTPQERQIKRGNKAGSLQKRI